MAIVWASSSGLPDRIAGAVLGFLALISLVFSLQTVAGDDGGLSVILGPGLPVKRFAWSEIASCTSVRNSLLAGWGIRYLGDGWMYNVSGLDAVELRLTNGRRYRIGTAHPKELEAFIRSHAK